MRTAYILHGSCDKDEYFRITVPSPSNAHWLPWLQRQFLRTGTLAHCLEMPVPYAPVYEDWCRVWERQWLAPDSVVVGHSAGCGFILKWLAAHPEVNLAKLVLVVPWRDPQGEMGDFLAGNLDATLAQRVGGLHVFVSEDDMHEVLVSTAEIEAVCPTALMHHFEGKGHFCKDDLGDDAFEELWQICQ